MIEFRRPPRAYELAAERLYEHPWFGDNPFRLPVAERLDASWRADAACTGMPTAWWYPPTGIQPAQAVAICEGCPVRQQCLDAALAEEGTTGGPHGVRGGLTAQARRRLAKERRRAGRP